MRSTLPGERSCAAVRRPRRDCCARPAAHAGGVGPELSEWQRALALGRDCGSSRPADLGLAGTSLRSDRVVFGLRVCARWRARECGRLESVILHSC